MYVGQDGADEWVAGAVSTGTRPLGRMTVSVPEELLDRSLPKATGVVPLPDHIAWSPPTSTTWRIVGKLRAGTNLALAGGGAFIVSGVLDRPTTDLDFFAPYP